MRWPFVVVVPSEEDHEEKLAYSHMMRYPIDTHIDQFHRIGNTRVGQKQVLGAQVFRR